MSDDDGETYCDQKPIFLHHHGGWCWLRSPGCQASGWSISNSPLCDDYRNNNVNLVEKLFPTIEFRFQISHYITIDNGHHTTIVIFPPQARHPAAAPPQPLPRPRLRAEHPRPPPRVRAQHHQPPRQQGPPLPGRRQPGGRRDDCRSE